ncbi:hypothetical protein KIW84_024112 [Lathyrus oleraceus]|uniref:Uncharacterized protein n=1 Tax=Pisum sativum TaxID=3888 RepID=A0A9D4YEQ7_PEA|nr:hypothetical protein KIW84_024112 [Pisum sativum]
MLELAGLLKQEEKVIQPHEKRCKIVTPSTAEVRKEVKLGPLQRLVESRMVALLKGHVDTFTWSCQDMPGSDTDVIMHKLPWRGDCPLEKQNVGATKQSRGVLSDYVTPQPIEDYQPMKFEFPDEDISSWYPGYRTSVRASTGATPFSVVYGMEAVLPVEVQIPSLRVLMDVKLQEAEWVGTRYEELSLIEEKRLAAICHGQLYQQRMKRAFDRKVRPRVYHVGDMVLKRILPPQNDRRGKWTPNYEGPFVVKKVFSGGALLLTTMDGEDFPSPVNADAVKKYFV